MELCPPEILSQIFSFACIDDGYTGRSLSLVSRYIYQASLPTRFQSIACRNAAQILTFCSILERTPSHYRNVCYLLVSSHHSDIDRLSKTRMIQLGIMDPLSYHQKIAKHISSVFHPPQNVRKSHVENMRALVISTISRILTHVAPTIRTFSSHVSLEYHEKFSLPKDLPHIVEMIISRKWPNATINSKELRDFGVYPSLRRLTLTGSSRSGDTCIMLGHIEHFAPHLTHLCLDACLSLPVVDYVLDHFDRAIAESSTAIFPSCMRLLFLHNSSSGHIQGVPVLRRTPDDLFSFDPGWYPFPREVDDNAWVSAWLDSVAGGEGFWSRGRVPTLTVFPVRT